MTTDLITKLECLVINDEKNEKNEKKSKGQFYTTNANYILDGFIIPTNTSIIEPFAGHGDLIEWAISHGSTYDKITAYDISPSKYDKVCIQSRDSIYDPPDYKNKFVLTNPPYLARNKAKDKTLYDKYKTNDLYKCFMISLSNEPECAGGIIIIPAGFFLSPRKLDIHCRNRFMSTFKITKIRYFEETVFNDTSITVIALMFDRVDQTMRPLIQQSIEWTLLPKKEVKILTISKINNWIVHGDIYNINANPNITVRRHVVGSTLRQNEYQTFMTLNAVDSGKKKGRISLTYKYGYVYPAKECSRAYATLRINVELTDDQQKQICIKFNEYIEQKRTESWSLFLPQFRESKEYARKRIPFELAYSIVSMLITNLISNLITNL